MVDNLGYDYADGSVLLAEGLNVPRLGAAATGGKINPSGNLSHTEGILVGWVFES
jgi:hypothetical protein